MAHEQEDVLHEADIKESLEEEGSVGYTNAFVANASVAHALNSTFSDTEVEAALNALGVKVNAILAMLINNGLMASS